MPARIRSSLVVGTLAAVAPLAACALLVTR